MPKLGVLRATGQSMTSPKSPNCRLTRAEIEAKLSSLSGADWGRLQSLARLMSAGLPEWNSEDLLQEAITKVLEGDRVWPRDVHFLVAFKVLMRGVASNQRKKEKVGPIDRRVAVDPDESDVDSGHVPSATAEDAIDPETIVDGQSQLKYLEQLLADDEEVAMVAMAWAEGLRGKLAAEELGYDAKRYDAARKRLELRLKPLASLRKSA